MTKPKKPRRHYVDAAGNRLPSVTTIIGLLNKPALMGWAARMAAEYVGERLRGCILTGDSDDEFVNTVIAAGKNAHNTTRDHAAKLGTDAHALVERHYDGETIAVDVGTEDAALVHGSYRRTVEHFTKTGTELIYNELQMVDPVLGYGGTMDFVLRRGSRFLVGDLKTGKGVYDEVVIQLGAYTSLLKLAVPTLEIDGGVVVHSPIHGEVAEYEITKDQLAYGASIFGALLLVYKNIDKCKLNKGNDE